MQANKIHLHSIILSEDCQPIVNNHTSFGRFLGCNHSIHRLSSPQNSDKTLVYYKYSLISRFLRNAIDGDILVLLDDSAVIFRDVNVVDLLGADDYWLATHAFNGRPDGSALIFRACAMNRAKIERVLDRLRLFPQKGFNRWEHLELSEFSSHAFDKPIGDITFSSMLFPPFGHHLPEVSTFILSLDPTSHANVQDVRIRNIFINHINHARMTGTLLYQDIEFPTAQERKRDVVNPSSPVALMTLYTPEICDYAQFSERNITRYCNIHGYTHYIYRDIPDEYRGNRTGNWLKADLLLDNISNHEQISWVDADILIHQMDRPLGEVTLNQPMTLVRDIDTHPFNSGFMTFKNAPESVAYLRRVKQLIDDVQDKSSVYVSGSDQAYFIEAWKEFGGSERYPLSDCVSSNSHPALVDDDTFMVHYMGFGNRLRMLAMHDDDALVRSRGCCHESRSPSEPFRSA